MLSKLPYRATLALVLVAPWLMAPARPSMIDSYDKDRQVFQRPEQGNVRPQGERHKFLRPSSHGILRRDKDQSRVDFSETQVNGQRLDSLAIPIVADDPDRGDSLVSVRVRWYAEMMQSAANLEAWRQR